MTGHAEKSRSCWGLPYRKIILCTGDMGFAAKLTTWKYDPYRTPTVRSLPVPNVWDFQARRMQARCRSKSDKNPSGSYRTVLYLVVRWLQYGKPSAG